MALSFCFHLSVNRRKPPPGRVVFGNHSLLKPREAEGIGFVQKLLNIGQKVLTILKPYLHTLANHRVVAEEHVTGYGMETLDSHDPRHPGSKSCSICMKRNLLWALATAGLWRRLKWLAPDGSRNAIS